MEQWNMDNLEAIVREANAIRNISLYEVQQRTYIELYKDLHISTGIDPSGEFCLYAPLLNDEDKNMSLAKQVKKIERSEAVPSFETFQRTFRRELPKILDVMLNTENSLELFKQDDKYRFSAVQSLVLHNLLHLWITEEEDAENFSEKRYNAVAPHFLQKLQNGVRYLLMGCFEDKIDLEELQQTWRERFECIPKSELSELKAERVKAEWVKAKEHLQKALRTLEDVLNWCILDEITPNDIMDYEKVVLKTFQGTNPDETVTVGTDQKTAPDETVTAGTDQKTAPDETVTAGTDQKLTWPIEDQIKYMTDCEEKLIVLTNEFFDNSVRGQNEAYKDINEKIEKLKQGEK